MRITNWLEEPFALSLIKIHFILVSKIAELNWKHVSFLIWTGSLMNFVDDGNKQNRKVRFSLTKKIIIPIYFC